MRPNALFLCVLCAFVCAANVAYGAVTTIQAFSFGSFVVKKNDAQYDITINTNSTYSFDSGGYIEISNPTEGIYDITGLPPSTAIVSVVVTQVTPLSFSGKNFQMLSFQETHPGSTDPAGVARIEVGGTARSSGDMTAYPDGTYNGQVQIQINF